MKKLLIATTLVFLATSASAMNLKKCEGVSTPNGFKYIGTYCVDFACTYITTRMFDHYCPYSIE